mmetsp:Transcript_61849/g.108322  ORF Transcript_61849/g.108322 Transcript_61849/m.108322 type:complete len:225 (-) Transcript_61849:150-824(-)
MSFPCDGDGAVLQLSSRAEQESTYQSHVHKEQTHLFDEEESVFSHRLSEDQMSSLPSNFMGDQASFKGSFSASWAAYWQCSASSVFWSFSSTTNCNLCDAVLGKRYLNPRHHCRSCWALVCGSCSRKREVHSQTCSLAMRHRERVCKKCEMNEEVAAAEVVSEAGKIARGLWKVASQEKLSLLESDTTAGTSWTIEGIGLDDLRCQVAAESDCWLEQGRGEVKV